VEKTLSLGRKRILLCCSNEGIEKVIGPIGRACSCLMATWLRTITITTIMIMVA